MPQSKSAYFQGTEEPTPKKKKYKSEPALVMQPRFKEPLYNNYDLYDTEGVDGPAKHGPGTGLYQNMDKYDSVSDFREKKKKNKEKYKAEDLYKHDDGSISKSKEKKRKRAQRRKALLMVLASDENNIDFLVDEQIKSAPILGENGVVSDSVPIGGLLDKYLPKYDFEGKSPADLDFGTNYGEEETHDYIAKLQEMMDEKLETLNPKEPPIFGLPQGIDPVSDLDNLYEQDPRYGVTESGNTSYDKM